jgi:hypothetical protein
MQIWKWLLILGLLFLITYNPSTRTLADFFERPMVVEGDRHGRSTYDSRETQSDSGASDDD